MDECLCQRAAPYAELLERRQGCLREPVEIPDELHLQALWQDTHQRPSLLTLSDGTPVEIFEVGRWNRSEGPDFQDALISVNGLLRRGDVELHLRPNDWDLHQHTGNPAYGNVILHVTWSEQPIAKTLPEGIPTLALRPQLPTFDLTALDLSAIPYPTNTHSHPCIEALRKSPGALDRLLTGAGTFRLQLKARRLIEGVAAQEPFQHFYEALLRTMGYGRNADTFSRLAHEHPFARIESLPALQRFAALAGVAGLLKEHQRKLWDLWFLSGLPPPLTPYAWDFRGMRPQNHPLRRLAGAMGILENIGKLLETSLRDLPEALCEASNLLQADLESKSALIGRSRANAIVTNLFVPYRLALGTLNPDRLNDLPGEDISMPMRDTWHRLTGSLHNLPKDGLRQQGLLQIYSDFCHNPNLTCATCPIAQH